MNTRKLSLASVCAAAFFVVLALTHGTPARASLIQDLSVSGGYAGTGQIIFDTDTGNNVADVDAFDFTITSSDGGLPNISFGLADIANISWSIDPTDWSLTLFLQTALTAVTGGQVSMVLTNDGAIHDDLCGALGSNSDPTYCGNINQSTILVGRNTLTTTAIHPAVQVPEPGTLALFGIGLAGFGFVRRRKAA